MIAIVGSERFKGGVRVEFVCGGRALRAHRSLREAVSGGVRLLSVLPADLPSAIEKLQAASKSQQRTQQALQEQLAVHEAKALVARGQKIGNVTLVAAAATGWDANGLKKLASAVTSSPDFIAVLITAESPSLIVVARSANLTLDAGAVLRTLLDRFGGKGGGKGAMAQGGGLNGAPEEILATAREAVSAGA
jgi:alanyl-tRNA synthetase